MKRPFHAAIAGMLAVATAMFACADDSQPQNQNSFARDRLVAWCIVPFDAARRGPADRVAMLKRLGLKRVAYDWRAEHVATFEEEIRQYQQHGIEFFAFWSWHDEFAPLVEKYGIRPQFWLTNPSPARDTQAQRVETAANQLLPIAQRAAALGCQVGLYNHGGWGGEPENLIAVAEQLRTAHNLPGVGIVYNFHHAHDHISDFEDAFERMQPYLLCLNLNGMADPQAADGLTNKILPIGQGVHEQDMIRVVQESGYQGPIGIIHHRDDLDAELSLKENLDGLEYLLKAR